LAERGSGRLRQMHFALLFVLMVLPGAWLSFGAGSNHLSYSVRFALAITLSPVVLAIQFYGLRIAGLTFQQVVPALQLLNFGSILLIGRAFGSRRPRMSWRQGIRGAGVYASVAACVSIPWLWEPNFRRYSWHGLLHTDIVYTFARGALLPEEPELAGVSLGYPWIGHICWSVLAWSADLSPTVIYLVTNLALLAAIGMLYYSLARDLGASELTSLAAPVILALGTNLPGLIGWSIIPPNDNGFWWAILGDLRYAPFLVKFVTFETMPFGLVLYSALAFLAVSALQNHKGLELVLMPVVVMATGALYPNLFPASVLLLAGLIGTLLFGREYTDGQYTGKDLVGLVVLSVIGVVGGILFVKLYTISRANGVLEISSPAAIAKKSVAAALALGPFVAAVYLMWRSEASARRAPLLTLAFGALSAVALNLLLRIGGLNEYKFLMAAGICLAAPAMIGLERTFLKTQRARWGILVTCPLILVLVMVSYSINRIPNHGTKPLDASAASFWLRLAPSNPDTNWINAIRKNSPPATVIAINHPEFHATSFTARSLLVPTQGARPHFGYNMSSEFNMLVERGYNRELFQERYKLLQRIYKTELIPEMTEILKNLRSLKRPIAIVYEPTDGRTFLDWLRTNRIGTDLFDDNNGRAVYLIRP
jgi:hypothetical protein